MPRPQKPGEGNDLSPSVKKLADEIGLKMTRSPFIASSRPALEAAEWAREKGKFDQFHLAVFKTYWEEGKNIGLRSVLREIAEGCGLDWEELERSLDEKRYAGRIDGQNTEAGTIGITGIPAYIIGDHLVVGAQPYQNFRRAVELAQKRHQPQT